MRAKLIQHVRKLFQNDPTSSQNRPKTTPNLWKWFLGPFSAPNCAQVGSRTLTGVRGRSLFMILWNIIRDYGTIFGAPGNRRSLQNRTFEYRRALWPSKNALWEGVRKKHENCMKNRCQNWRFLMAQNHVWRYTLRLFNTFAIFDKSRKIYAKREPKSLVFWSKSLPWVPRAGL